MWLAARAAILFGLGAVASAISRVTCRSVAPAARCEKADLLVICLICRNYVQLEQRRAVAIQLLAKVIKNVLFDQTILRKYVDQVRHFPESQESVQMFR